MPVYGPKQRDDNEETEVYGRIGARTELLQHVFNDFGFSIQVPDPVPTTGLGWSFDCSDIAVVADNHSVVKTTAVARYLKKTAKKPGKRELPRHK